MAYRITEMDELTEKTAMTLILKIKELDDVRDLLRRRKTHE